MVKKTYSTPVTLRSSRRRVSDKAVSFSVESRYEVSSDDFGTIDSLLGGIGVLVLTDEKVTDLSDKQIQELLEDMPENDTQEVKSPSKRLRSVFWVLLEQTLGRKPTAEEFTDFYQKEYNKLIDHYKDKLE